MTVAGAQRMGSVMCDELPYHAILGVVGRGILFPLVSTFVLITIRRISGSHS